MHQERCRNTRVGYDTIYLQLSHLISVISFVIDCWVVPCKVSHIIPDQKLDNASSLFELIKCGSGFSFLEEIKNPFVIINSAFSWTRHEAVLHLRKISLPNLFLTKDQGRPTFPAKALKTYHLKLKNFSSWHEWRVVKVYPMSPWNPIVPKLDFLISVLLF